MKRIIAPIALALLSTVAIADESNNIQKNFNIIRQYLPATSNSADNLPAWNSVNYKNFTQKTIAFFNPADCVIARDYAMTQVHGNLIIKKNKRTTLDAIVQAVSNNIETRISCRPASPESSLSMADFELVYETATRRSDDEILELKIENARKQEDAQKQREDKIKSKVDNILNRETLGTSYKLYEPK